MRPLILISTLLLSTFCGQTDRSDKSKAIATKSDYNKWQTFFNKRLKRITWNKEGDEKLITDAFYNTYLRDIEEFKKRNEYMDLYYHSIPDIDTERCLVIIKTISKYDLPSYSYKLVDLEETPKVIFELAALENYPDGQKRVSSVFLPDNNLTKTKVTESLGEYDQASDSYQMVTIR